MDEKIKSNQFMSKMICIYIFFIPYSICQAFQDYYISVLSTFIIDIFFVYYLYKKKKLIMDQEVQMFLFCFFLPLLLSIIFVVFHYITIDQNIQYGTYLRENLFPRLTNIILNFFLFIGLTGFLCDNNKLLKKIINIYIYGVLIIVYIGLWQWLSYYFDIPFLDIQTRSNMHGLGGAISDVLIPHRLTSIAAEPSYLVPVLIEALILILYIYKVSIKRFITMILPTLLVLIFSFSLGGYINFLLVLFCMALLNNKVGAVFRRVWFVFLVVISVTVIYFDLSTFLLPIIYRIENFDMLLDGRAYMSIKPFEWIFNSSLLNIFFGYGIGAYKFASTVETLPNGDFVHVTSNNMFSDFVYETGLVGFFLISLYFLYLFISSYKRLLDYRNVDKNIICAYALSIHLFLTSFYRADYMTPRFIFLIIVIIALKKLSKNKKEC